MDDKTTPATLIPKAEFLSEAVTNAEWRTQHGYHCGPIPSCEIDWTGYDPGFYPQEHQSVIYHTMVYISEHKRFANPALYKNEKDLILSDVESEYSNPKGLRAHPVTGVVATNTSATPQKVSATNGGICWIAVSKDIMCGARFTNAYDLRTHQVASHSPSVLYSTNWSVVMAEEIQLGQNALKNYILRGEWRKAKFKSEPGLGRGIIRIYCDSLEHIAEQDEEFAATYGTRFHRESVHQSRAALARLDISNDFSN